MPHPTLIIAAGSTLAAGGDPSRVFVWVGILIFATIAGGIAILFTRRRLLSRDSSTEDAAGLMQSLRSMRDSGKITPEEYDATRKSIAERAVGRSSTPKAGGKPDPR
jgi:hypothetical protein